MTKQLAPSEPNQLRLICYAQQGASPGVANGNSVDTAPPQCRNEVERNPAVNLNSAKGQ
jgi:hypothetical protein